MSLSISEADAKQAVRIRRKIRDLQTRITLTGEPMLRARL
jgi:hypothetical protein